MWHSHPKFSKELTSLAKTSYRVLRKTRKSSTLLVGRRLQNLRKMGVFEFKRQNRKNIALLAKLNWRFNSKKSSFWVRVLTKKYHKPRRVFRTQAWPSSCSPTWTALRKGNDIFSKGSKWIPGRYSSLSLWFDKMDGQSYSPMPYLGPSE